MDSTSAACAAAPEWHWFWVWFGLLVLVNVATEIALCTIAATTRHLLVCLTSLGHHNMQSYNIIFYNYTDSLLALFAYFRPVEGIV